MSARLNDMILIRAETGLREALKALACRDGVSAAEVARSALRAVVTERGAPVLPRDRSLDGPSAERAAA
jgi:hypothetical protein